MNTTPEIPDELTYRQADATESMIAIADLAGGDWPHLGRDSIRTPCGLAQEDEDSQGVRLLEDIRDVFAGLHNEEDGQPTLDGKPEAIERITSVALVKKLTSIETSPWPELGKARKPLTATGLARLLKPFEIVLQTMRVDGRVAKSYDSNDVADAFERYLPQKDPNVTVEPLRYFRISEK